MSTLVETYLKIGDEFVPVKQFSGALPDDYYLDGAIYCRINDRDVLTLHHWDLVDQLWAYIIEGMLMIARGEDYDVYFPDQPLRLRLRLLSRRVVEVTVGGCSQKVDVHTLVRAMADGAVQFFTEMKRILPDASDTWRKYLNDAELLLAWTSAAQAQPDVQP